MLCEKPPLLAKCLFCVEAASDGKRKDRQGPLMWHVCRVKAALPRG